MPNENISRTWFLGQGWRFPPEFSHASGEALMSADEEDVRESLRILFGTMTGERFLVPDYGLDMHEYQFEPITTTLRTYLKDRVRNAVLLHEPRIDVLALEVDSPHPETGELHIRLEYRIRGSNSRFNLVFPFYQHDSNEARARLTGGVSG